MIKKIEKLVEVLNRISETARQEEVSMLLQSEIERSVHLARQIASDIEEEMIEYEIEANSIFPW